MRRAPWISAVLALSACATTGGGTTWEDDARDGIAPHHTRTSSGAVALDPRLADGFGGHAGAAGQVSEGAATLPTTEELELALIRFTTKRRALFNRDGALQGPGQGGTGGWPRPLEAAFTSILDLLEPVFAAPAGQVSRRVLIQARVTLEVELSAAESRFGPAPVAVGERVPRLFASIARHMRATAPQRAERMTSNHPITLAWPLSPVIVTSPFGYRRDPILGRRDIRFHAGVDLGGETGEPVHAAGPGRVVHAGWLGGHGRAVIVQHASGYQTTYAHLREVLTTVGAEVDVESPIGLVGSSGRSTGPHLHFEVRHGGAPIDPQEIVTQRLVGDANEPADSPDRHAAR